MTKKPVRIEIKFGIPEHGWLLMNFKYGEFQLELDISDVPVDPMEQLCDSLIQIMKGINNPNIVIWHLEPYCYYLQLERFDKIYRVTILESDEFESPMIVTKAFNGGFNQIILPLYRCIKEFNSHSYKKPHWDEMKQERIKLLTGLIKKRT